MAEYQIQPQELEIPKKDPFKYDLLNREEVAKTLTELVSSIKGPCVMALDAPWGTGKTTFLKMWSQHLDDNKFPVVLVNVWETDFAKDPFVALCAELTSKFRSERDVDLSKNVVEMEKAAQAAFEILSMVISFKTGGTVNISPIGRFISALTGSRQRPLDEYRKVRDSINLFKNSLQTVAKKLVENKNNFPLIVIIDELDRCRPSYAVELLETAKHLFTVDKVIFVLAVNHTQLAHAVKAVYGDQFDAEGYLRRFFDIDFHLPEPEQDKLLTGLFNTTGIKKTEIRETLQAFLNASTLSLRDITQVIYRLGLVLRSLSRKNEITAKFVIIALILRSLNETIYRQFINKEISDSQVAEGIFSITSLEPLRWDTFGILFQVGLVLAYKELSTTGGAHIIKTPLQEEIEQYIEKINDIKERQRKKKVQEDAYLELQDKSGSDFMEAYRHIELFTAGDFSGK